jgi:hypothetical protein
VVAWYVTEWAKDSKIVIPDQLGQLDLKILGS